jgi:TRAP-type mannitol/chloroaromatic compound transport system permease small subunit
LKVLLKISTAIDGLNEKFGFIANYFVLSAALVSAGNALVEALSPQAGAAFQTGEAHRADAGHGIDIIGAGNGEQIWTST